MTKTTEAQARAHKNYIVKNVDEIKVRIAKGKRAELVELAEKEGHSSLNSFIVAVLEEKTGINLKK